MAEKYEDDSGKQKQEHHNEYLRIIDDLSSDLNNLSTQVNMVQSDYYDDEIAKRFEVSLKGLETQNDLLQAAVDTLCKEKESIEKSLQTENEDLKKRLSLQEEETWALKNEIDRLRNIPCVTCELRAKSEIPQFNPKRRIRKSESDEKLQELEFELKRKSRQLENLKSENARLHEDFNDIRKNQAKLKLLQRRGITPDRNQNESKVLEQLNTSEEMNKENLKSLQKASKQIDCLNKEIESLKINEECSSKEIQLLQAELIALKESEAAQIGIQQSLKQQILSTTTELYEANENLKKCVQAKDKLEITFREFKNHFQNQLKEKVDKYNKLVEDFNMLKEEYQKLVQIEQEKTDIINNYSSWKEEQKQHEQLFIQKYRMLENHIKELLKDKQDLLDKLNDSESENYALLQALEQSGLYSSSDRSPGMSSASRGYRSGNLTASTNDPVSKVIENIRHTSRRLSQKRSILEDEASRMPK